MFADERNAVFSPKDPQEVVALNFDFSVFGTGWTTAVVTCEYLSGITDPAAGAMVVNTVVIDGSIVTQDIAAGIQGTDYLIKCKVTRGNNIYIISGILPVRDAVGSFSQSEILD